MDTTKKLLNISIAVSIVLCSLSLFIYCIKCEPLKAANTKAETGDYIPVGILIDKPFSDETFCTVIGYNGNVPWGEKKIVVLASEKIGN